MRLGLCASSSSSALLLLLLLLLLATHSAASSAATASTAPADDDRDSGLVHLFPEQPRLALRLAVGASQRFRVHALAPAKVYDVKVSYPASMPSAFVLAVERVVAEASPDANNARPARRLNTAKLRLHPRELLRRALGGDQHADDGEHRVNVDAYRLAMDPQQQLEDDTQDATVTVDIVLRANAEGVSAVVDPRTRECVFDIVVEEMLLGGAFPLDTLTLLAWLALVLVVALKWAYPYLLRKVALELSEERVVYVGSSSRSRSSSSSHGSHSSRKKS